MGEKWAIFRGRGETIAKALKGGIKKQANKGKNVIKLILVKIKLYILFFLRIPEICSRYVGFILCEREGVFCCGDRQLQGNTSYMGTIKCTVS